MQAVIFCGGLATRLGNISKKIPKILLEVGGRAVLDRQLDLLKAVGVKETILASGHLHDMLHKHVGVYREGMHIRYVKENRKLGNRVRRFPSISSHYALETDATWIDIEVPERLAYARQRFQNGVCR